MSDRDAPPTYQLTRQNRADCDFRCATESVKAFRRRLLNRSVYRVIQLGPEGITRFQNITSLPDMCACDGY